MAGLKVTLKIVDRGRRFLRARSARGAMLTEFRSELAPRILRVGRQTAPHASGALARGLRATVSGRGAGVDIDLRSTVRSKAGFAYTRVTRFGRGPVEAKRGRALAFQVNGKTIFRKRVRGYKPSHDWADDTQRAAQPHVARSAQRIGRRLAGELT